MPLLSGSNVVISMTRSAGRVSGKVGGITLKNQVREVNSIEDIADIVETNVVNGATLVYNATLDKYEVKPPELDGGTF